MKFSLNFLSSTILTGILYFLGGWDKSIKYLTIVMTIDYITGILKAIKNKKINSKIGLLGFLKKFGYLLLVGLSVVIDYLTGNNGAIRTMTIYFFIANDGISILENLGKIGVPLPKKLFEIFEQLKQDNK